MLRLPVEGEFPSLAGGLEWLNSKPLTAESLRGNVVLIDFWTYTCVNWLRTLPYVRAWDEKYRDNGLVVIGVHTPEFGFEKNVDNVERAMRDMHIHYPVAIDSNYGIWNAFRNNYWPAAYAIDASGQIRYHHFGEGAYEESERVIKQLLVEAGFRDTGDRLVSVDPRGLEVAADWNDVRSEENFLGSDRTVGFARSPDHLKLNEWALSGEWTPGSESVALDKGGGRITYRFHARDVNLVMGASNPGATIRFRVFIDGRPPGDARGDDADANGDGIASWPRTYQLIRQQKPIVDRRFEIEFLDEGVAAYDFTFG